MVALFVEPLNDKSHFDVDAWLDAALPGWLAGSPVASIATWSSVPLSDSKPDFIAADPGADRRRLQIHFVEGDPLDCWEQFGALADRMERAGVARVVFGAPFVATDIGTDRYVDELW